MIEYHPQIEALLAAALTSGGFFWFPICGIDLVALAATYMSFGALSATAFPNGPPPVYSLVVSGQVGRITGPDGIE